MNKKALSHDKKSLSERDICSKFITPCCCSSQLGYKLDACKQPQLVLAEALVDQVVA